MDAVRGRLSRCITTRSVGVGAMIVGLVGPIVCIVLSRTDRSIGDVALIELRTRDVLSAHPPLTGAYSRYGWSHPGPLPFYVFALPFRLLGNDSDALRLTALLFNLVVIVIICWLVARRGHAPLAFVAATTIALVWGLQPHSLSDAWNVTVAILPFLLTIVACWCALCGDRWALLVAALSFSFVFQAHTGFGLVLVPLMAFTLLSRGLAALRSSRTIDRRVLLATAAVVVAFVPVLYDMAAHWPGNLGRLAKWSLRNDEPKVGFGDGLRVVGRATSLSFLTHPQVPGRFLLTIDTISTGIAPGIAVVLLLMACAITIRRRLPAERSLCICLLLVWAAGSFAAANITEPLLPWLIDWLQPLAWLTWAAVALVAWRTVQGRVQSRDAWPMTHRLVGSVAALTFVVGTVVYAHHNATTAYLSADGRSAVDALTAAAETVDDAQPITVVYEGDPLTAGTTMNGVVNRLDRAGRRVCVDPSLAYQFGSQRVCANPTGQYVMIRSEQTDTPPPDGATTLVVSDPLTPQQRAEADGLSDQLAATLVAYDREAQVFLLYSPLVELVLAGDPPDELLRQSDAIDRLDQLRSIPGTRYGLYLVPG